MNAKKIAAYAVLLLTLAGTAFVVHEFRMTNEVVRHPELFLSGSGGSGGGTPHVARDDSMFAKPPPGKRERRTAGELAWMLKESIELDVLHRFAMRGSTLDAYNARVRAYNERAETIVFVEGDMETAKRRVAVSLDEIVRGAIDDALASSSAEAGQSGDRDIRTAQTYLRVLDFYPPEPDGRMNGETAHAVRMFRMATGLPITEEIDKNLLEVMRDALVKKLRPETIGF